MKAIEFYDEFVKNTSEQKRVTLEQIPSTPELAGHTYLDIYKHHEAAYTELITKNIIHNIIANVDADKISDKYPKYNKLVPQHEYFRIDCTGYQHRFFEIDGGNAEKVGLYRHLWDLKIAVEHENNKKDWMDEVIKLAHVRCPLKVIIGYNHCDQRDEGDKSDKAKLKFVAEWMRQVSAFDKNANEEILIIIGNGAPENKRHKTYKSFDYRGYMYDYDANVFNRLQYKLDESQMLDENII